MLARQYIPIDVDDEDLRTILLNAHINDHFLSLGREVCNNQYTYKKTIFFTVLQSTACLCV